MHRTGYISLFSHRETSEPGTRLMLGKIDDTLGPALHMASATHLFMWLMHS